MILRLVDRTLVALLSGWILACASAGNAIAASPMLQNLDTDVFESLDQHRRPGRWLVVMIWAHDCKICDHEVGAYQAFHQRQRGGNADVLGITLDGEAGRVAAQDFVARHRLGFANLLGEPETVAAYYQALTGERWVGTPTFLVFGPDGELRAKQVGAVEVEIVEQFIAANGSS